MVKRKSRIRDFGRGMKKARGARSIEELLEASRILKRARKKNPVRIPEKVLAWRERQRKGSIMKPKTFRAIERKAGRGGYLDPSAVGGKAYWITVLNKYLDSHPREVSAMSALRRLVETRGKRRNPIPKLRYGKEKFTMGDWDIVMERLAKLKPGSKIRYKGKEWRVSPRTMELYYKSYGPAVFRGWSRVGRNPKQKKKWYLGYRSPGKAKLFSSVKAPTLSSHGHLYTHVVGPFKNRTEAIKHKAYSY